MSTPRIVYKIVKQTKKVKKPSSLLSPKRISSSEQRKLKRSPLKSLEDKLIKACDLFNLSLSATGDPLTIVTSYLRQLQKKEVKEWSEDDHQIDNVIFQFFNVFNQYLDEKDHAAKIYLNDALYVMVKKLLSAQKVYIKHEHDQYLTNPINSYIDPEPDLEARARLNIHIREMLKNKCDLSLLSDGNKKNHLTFLNQQLAFFYFDYAQYLITINERLVLAKSLLDEFKKYIPVFADEINKKQFLVEYYIWISIFYFRVENFVLAKHYLKKPTTICQVTLDSTGQASECTLFLEVVSNAANLSISKKRYADGLFYLSLLRNHYVVSNILMITFLKVLDVDDPETKQFLVKNQTRLRKNIISSSVNKNIIFEEKYNTLLAFYSENNCIEKNVLIEVQKKQKTYSLFPEIEKMTGIRSFIGTKKLLVINIENKKHLDFLQKLLRSNGVPYIVAEEVEANSKPNNKILIEKFIYFPVEKIINIFRQLLQQIENDIYLAQQQEKLLVNQTLTAVSFQPTPLEQLPQQRSEIIAIETPEETETTIPEGKQTIAEEKELIKAAAVEEVEESILAQNIEIKEKFCFENKKQSIVEDNKKILTWGNHLPVYEKGNSGSRVFNLTLKTKMTEKFYGFVDLALDEYLTENYPKAKIKLDTICDIGHVEITSGKNPGYNGFLLFAKNRAKKQREKNPLVIIPAPKEVEVTPKTSTNKLTNETAPLALSKFKTLYGKIASKPYRFSGAPVAVTENAEGKLCHLFTVNGFTPDKKKKHFTYYDENKKKLNI